MKKTVSLFVAFMMLAMCVLPAAPAEASVGGDHTIEMREFPFYLTDPDITLSDPFPLYFIDGVDDLPYIEIEDLAGLLAFLNTDEYFGNDPDYGLNIDYNSEIVTLTRENGYTMEINFEKDTMVFDDYDAFIHGSNDTTLLDLVSEKGFDSEGNPSLIMRDKEASFDRYGDVLAIDLAGYDIDLLVKEQKYLIPLQTMSDFLFAVPLGNCVIFNGEALFLASDGALFDYSEGDYSPLAEIFYSVEPHDERSDELAEYSYSELCLLLDTFYGLKEPHDIKNFSQIFWQIGYDEPLRGKSASDADIALKSFIDYYLDDLHSVFNEFSPMVGLNPISSSTGMSNRKITDFGKEYAAARAVYYPDGFLSYEEVGNTAYITFDSFDSNFTGEAFYAAAADGEDLPEDTIGLIIYAHQQITREGSPIENVVLDLSNNLGGAVDAAVFVLGWFLGDAPFSVKNMTTGAMSTSVYRADVNLDREFDEKDTVADKNLFCLISPVSFSCGNLVPAALKSSQKVTLVGKTSGGGSCVVLPASTAYGTVFQISCCNRMSFLKNGSFYDIDQGVDPDVYLSKPASFYDRAALTDYLNTLR